MKPAQVALFAVVLFGCGTARLPFDASASGSGGGGGGGATQLTVDAAVPTSASGRAEDASVLDAALADATSDATTPDAGPPRSDCAAGVAGLTVSDTELAGYRPYAVDGCTLVYVAPALPGAGTGELRVRDFTDGSDWLLAAAAEFPRRPSVAGTVIAWEATLDGKSVVRVATNGVVQTLSGSFDHAGEPRAALDAVAFTIWAREDALSDSDVAVFSIASGAMEVVLGGPGQQRFPDISATLVAASDFAEDPDQHYDGNVNDLSDVVVYDRATGRSTVRALPGKQAFPLLLSEDRLAYLHWEWGEVHPEPKFAAYHLRAGSLALASGALDVEIAKVIARSPPYVRPAAYRGTLEWVDSPNGQYQLWRAPADGSSATAVGTPSPAPLFAPAPAERFTLLGTRAGIGDPVRLEAIAR